MMKLLFGIFALFLLFGCAATDSHSDYHTHADLKVVLDGEIFDFNKSTYMSTPSKPLSEFAHMHDYNPYVVHFHSESATLGDFFTSIGMNLDSDCFSDGKNSYCNDGAKTLQFYVNGSPNARFEQYIPSDLDKILIYYGSSQPDKADFDLTSWACVYSKKCPAPEGVDVEGESCTATEPCEL